MYTGRIYERQCTIVVHCLYSTFKKTLNSTFYSATQSFLFLLILQHLKLYHFLNFYYLYYHIINYFGIYTSIVTIKAAGSVCALPAAFVKRFWYRLFSSYMVNQGCHICWNSYPCQAGYSSSGLCYHSQSNHTRYSRSVGFLTVRHARRNIHGHPNIYR